MNRTITMIGGIIQDEYWILSSDGCYKLMTFRYEDCGCVVYVNGVLNCSTGEI